MGPNRLRNEGRPTGSTTSRTDPSAGSDASAIDALFATLLGLLVGLTPLIWAVGAVLVAGFITEAESGWVVAIIWVPPALMTLLAAAAPYGREWRVGLRLGLLISAAGSLLLGSYGLVLVAMIAAGYAVGALVGRRRHHPRSTPGAAAPPSLDWTRRRH